jgi:type IX secretion system PorP/SprF family membrane protein
MKSVFISVFCLLSLNLLGQNFSMNGKTQLMVNPAFSGINDYGRLNLTANVINFSEITKVNSYLGYDSYVNKLHGAISGFNFNNIYSDFYSNAKFGLSYAYQGKINEKWNYSVGLGGVFNQYRYDWDNVVCFLPCPSGIQVNNYFGLSLGGLIYSKKWFLGYGAVEVNPTQLESYMARSNINFGYTFSFKKIEDLSLTSSLYLSLFHQGWSYAEIQVLAQYKFLYLGAKYGNNNYAFQVGADVFNRFRINYSFNNNFIKLANGFNLLHEISLQVKLPKTINKKSAAFNHLIY